VRFAAAFLKGTLFNREVSTKFALISRNAGTSFFQLEQPFRSEAIIGDFAENAKDSTGF
jgi:hypothetical protein